MRRRALVVVVVAQSLQPESANGLGLRVREEGADICKNGRGSGVWHGRSVPGKSAKSGRTVPSCVWNPHSPVLATVLATVQSASKAQSISTAALVQIFLAASDPSVGPSATVAFYTRRALRASYRPLPPTLDHTPAPPDLPLLSNIISLSRRASDCDATPC
jgi:hypothetical protein